MSSSFITIINVLLFLLKQLSIEITKKTKWRLPPHVTIIYHNHLHHIEIIRIELKLFSTLQIIIIHHIEIIIFIKKFMCSNKTRQQELKLRRLIESFDTYICHFIQSWTVFIVLPINLYKVVISSFFL